MFHLKDPKQFSPSWMEKVDADATDSVDADPKPLLKSKKGKGSSSEVI